MSSICLSSVPRSTLFVEALFGYLLGVVNLSPQQNRYARTFGYFLTGLAGVLSPSRLASLQLQRRGRSWEERGTRKHETGVMALFARQTSLSEKVDNGYETPVCACTMCLLY
ncbi:hypothetical protein GYMLUDRAFT_578788 [Collybiopsis luxurians FD-317 M1]|uniref:Uncharacterized protein n=1 Tax=Collybiopsis luxurians FD-317 M1 TaxID=944289 RepID=A0A0D0C0V3_9AGAR|nr:hypothetical protein GYMLUDRAFT_578788 [Collybiopsis luxurians FD-317 M1]